MTDSNTADDRIAELEEWNEQLEKRIAELEQQLQNPEMGRRSVLGALGLAGLGVGAGSIAATQTASASEGSGSIGTEDDPLENIWVENLNQLEDNVEAELLKIGGYRLTLNDTPDQPSEGDIRIKDPDEVED